MADSEISTTAREQMGTITDIGPFSVCAVLVNICVAGGGGGDTVGKKSDRLQVTDGE